MKDADDLAVTLETVDALFCSVADSIARSMGTSMEDEHQYIWKLFEDGYFRVVGTDDNVGIVPCHSHDERRLAAEQNKRLVDYRRRVIEEAQATGEPVERRSGAS